MHYEVVSRIDTNNKYQKEQIKRVKNDRSNKLISLFPEPNFRDKLGQTDFKAFNVIDYVTKRSINYDPSVYMYFNEVPTATNAEIFMKANYGVDIISNGDVIGNVILWPNTRRHVERVDYIYQNGERDFSENFASDGKKFSSVIYTHNKLQREDFYNDHEQPILRFYYEREFLSLVTVSDFKAGKVIERYSTVEEFLASTLGKLFTADDTVGINYMGYELLALSQSKSDNTLYLSEDPFDEAGNLKGNLKSVLNNNISYIQHVSMNKENFEKIKATDVPIDKILVN